MELTIATPATIETFFLVLVRTSTLLLATPLLGMPLIPPPTKVGLSVLIAVILTPLIATTSGPSLAFSAFLLGIAQEVLMGLLLAFAVTLIYGAVQTAGALLGLQFGFSLANVIDPTLRSQETVIGQFYLLLASLIFFLINGHHLVLIGLARSFEIAPPLTTDLLSGGNPAFIAALLNLSSAMFVSALRIGLPVMGALLLADVALAVISRAAPQMNVYFVGLPLKILIGLGAILLGLPLIVTTIGQLTASITVDMLTLIGRG